MSARPLKHKPGYAGTVVIDSVPTRVRGWKGKHSIDTYDDSGTGGAGWSSTAPALKSIEVSFTLDVPTAGLPAFQLGTIVPCIFTIDGTISYAGDFLITDMSPNVDLKGGVTLDVTAKNVDEVTIG